MSTASLQPSSTPRWMRHWLVAAGLYNLIWGGAMVLAPLWTLKMLGVSPASTYLWPQFWACIGMIIGVYGVGYVIASRDPARHWPIILVGLLGKILGPIGFVNAAMHDQLPWSMGATILTNDLLWWVPFTMMLWHAARASQPAPPEGSVTLETALDALRDDAGKSLRSLTNERPTLVVLLRHSGCTFCKEALADLSKRQAAIQKADISLAIIGMSPTSEALKAVGTSYGLTTAAWFADPDRLLYRALELKRGTFSQLAGLRVFIGGIRAALHGHGIGRLEGDGFQMPGAFVIHNGRIIRSYRHSTAADRPDLLEFACPLN